MERAVPILPADDISIAKQFYVDQGARTFGFIDPSGNTIFVIGPGRS